MRRMWAESPKDLFLIYFVHLLIQKLCKVQQDKTGFSFAESRPILCKDTIKKDMMKVDDKQKFCKQR